MLLKIIAKWRV